MPRFLFILSVVLISSVHPIVAQSLRFRHYTINDGLSQSSVRSILKDSTGFIWLATQDGLNRFDGQVFKSWKRNSKNKSSLSENSITQIVENFDHTLWIATNGGGINIYNIASDSMSSVLNGPASSNSDDNKVFSLLLTSERELWAGSGNGVSIINTTTHKITGRINSFQTSPAVITGLAEDQSKQIWVATPHDGLYIFDTRTRSTLKHVTLNELGSGIDHVERIRHIQSDKNGTSWVSTDNGLFECQFSNGAFRSAKVKLKTPLQDLSDNTVMCSLKDHEGKLWVGTQNGLLVSDHNEVFQHYNQDINNPYSLTDRVILTIYEDRDNILWLGTYNGLNKYVHEQSDLRSYKSDLTDRNKGLSVLRSIYTDDDVNIFVGGINRLALFNCETETYQEIRDTDGKNLQNVFSVTRDSDGNLWTGNSNGLQRIVSKGSMLQVAHALDHPELKIFKDLEVTQMVPVSPAKYLITTYNEAGLFLWDVHAHTVKNFLKNQTNVGGIPSDRVNHIVSAGENKFWLATGNGICLFDSDTEKFKSFAAAGTSPPYQALEVVNAILVRDEILWLATNGGLIKFNVKNNTPEFFTEDEGLSNNNLYSCVAMNDSVLWMSSNKGLSQFNTRTSKFANYDISDGLQSNEYNRYAWYVSKTGHLYFGGMEGFDVVSRQSSIQQHVVPLVITSIRIIENNQFAERYPVQHKGLELKYSQNAIGLSYAALDFSTPRRKSFLCKLEGFNDQWIDNGSNTTFSYTNLPPGNYVFRVKILEGQSIGETSYPFTILSPFWQTSWFTALVFMSGFALLAYVVRLYYARKMEKQRLVFEKRQAVQHERTRIATDMHDDLGAGLSRIKFLSESIGLKSENQEFVGEDVTRIKAYAHEMIDKMGEIVWALNEKNDSLMDLLSFTRAYAAAYLQENNLETNIRVPDDLPLTFVSGEFRRNIFLSVKEALHNIVKHAQATRVSIDISIHEALSIVIHDNGRGFDRLSIRPYSNGLANMQHRVQTIGGKFEISGHNGTEVRVTVPLRL